MAKHVFIDTNIFLNFYRYSDDLEELKKISHGEIIKNEKNENHENIHTQK